MADAPGGRPGPSWRQYGPFSGTPPRGNPQAGGSHPPSFTRVAPTRRRYEQYARPVPWDSNPCPRIGAIGDRQGRDAGTGPRQEGTQTANGPEGQLLLGVPPQASWGGARSGRTPEASDSKLARRIRGPNRSLATSWQVSMNGNGSGGRLWNCLLGRALGDTPVPNSTELHRTQANIHHAAAQKIRGLSSPECVGVRSRDHLLISRLKVRFLHGSPTKSGGSGAPGPPDRDLATVPWEPVGVPLKCGRRLPVTQLGGHVCDGSRGPTCLVLVDRSRLPPAGF